MASSALGLLETSAAATLPSLSGRDIMDSWSHLLMREQARSFHVSFVQVHATLLGDVIAQAECS